MFGYDDFVVMVETPCYTAINMDLTFLCVLNNSANQYTITHNFYLLKYQDRCALRTDVCMCVCVCLLSILIRFNYLHVATFTFLNG